MIAINTAKLFQKEFPEKVLNKLVFDTNKVEVVVAPSGIHLPLVQ